MFSASIVDARAVRSCGRKVSLWCLSWRQPPEPGGGHRKEVRDAVRLKKESYRAMLACGTPEAQLTGTGTGQASRSPDGPGGKNSGLGGVREEAEAGDSEVDSSITQAEVTEVVRKLLGGKAPGVDEIRPEYLKSLDVVGLSWLTRLCNIAWRLGTVPLEWQTGVVVPLFKKGDRRVCSNYRGITLLSLPEKVYMPGGTGEENSADSRPSDSGGTMRFSSLVVEHWTSSILSTCRVLEGLWEFAVVVKKELSRKEARSSRFTGQSTFPPSPMVMNFG
ncbi:hypothetical protein L3Q82_007303 [Scortum barcoo]|uniref:Uncharacterized protein n=1 Tax=Scortum barcoo TaxID=214431 RepID=A0ACB8WSF3_9TELE|nr:hypothetical protein L3Q82_007303 [Scortum barcoo]